MKPFAVKFSLHLKSSKGFSLLEVIASSMVILSVAATVSHLSNHPNAVMKSLERKWALVNFMHHQLQNLNQSGSPIPTSPVRYCSVCDQTNPGCGTICVNNGANTECNGIPPLAELNQINENAMGCYTTVVLDPTCDDQSGDAFDRSRASQICAAGRIKRSEGVDEHAISTYLFRS